MNTSPGCDSPREESSVYSVQGLGKDRSPVRISPGQLTALLPPGQLSGRQRVGLLGAGLIVLGSTVTINIISCIVSVTRQPSPISSELVL